MVYLYLAWMEGIPTASACGSVAQKNFFAQVHALLPVFVAMPEFVIAEEAFAFETLLFFSDVLWCGIGVVPGLHQQLLGFVLSGHGQGDCLGPKGVTLTEPVHNRWHVAFVLATEPVRHIPEEFGADLAEHPGWTTGTSVVFAPTPCESIECVYLGTGGLLCGARGKHFADFGARNRLMAFAGTRTLGIIIPLVPMLLRTL